MRRAEDVILGSNSNNIPFTIPPTNALAPIAISLFIGHIYFSYLNQMLSL